MFKNYTHNITAKQAIKLVKKGYGVCQLSFSYDDRIVCLLVLQDEHSARIGVLGMSIPNFVFISLQRGCPRLEDFVLASNGLCFAMRRMHSGEDLKKEFIRIFSRMKRPTNMEDYVSLLKTTKELQETFIISKFGSKIFDDMVSSLLSPKG